MVCFSHVQKSQKELIEIGDDPKFKELVQENEVKRLESLDVYKVEETGAQNY